MTPPRVEVGDKFVVCKLNKAFDGLKQSPQQWFSKQ